MNVCKCIKIVPLVLLINACTSGSNPETTTESIDDGTLSGLTSGTVGGMASDATNGVVSTDSVTGGVSADVASNETNNNASNALSADEIDALGASVGSVSGTNDQTVTDQPDVVEPAAQSVVQPVVQPNEVTSPVVTPATDNGTDINNDTGTNDGTSTNTGTSTPAVVNTPETQESPDNNSIVRIPFADRNNAPKIDGATLDYLAGTELLDGEWRSSAQFNAANEPLGISQYMFGEPGTNNDSASHHWAAVHDGVYLYVLVVSDDAGEHFQDTNELRKPWKDDSVELFIDGNNSRLNQYDGVDDFHITINLFSSSTDVVNSSFIANPQIRQSDTSATLPSDLIFAAGPEKGPAAANLERGRKDIYEIRIKLSELNIQIGSPFGIELQINDDDNGGSRDAKWGWNHPTGTNSDNDFTWQNPSFMGTAILLQ